MTEFISEIINEMIDSIPWRKVIKTFILILMGAIGFGLILAGAGWAIYALNFLPLLLWIPATFILTILDASFD